MGFIFFLFLLFLMAVILFGFGAVRTFFGSIFPSRRKSSGGSSSQGGTSAGSQSSKGDNPLESPDYSLDDNEIVVKTDLDDVPDVEYEKIEGE